MLRPTRLFVSALISAAIIALLIAACRPAKPAEAGTPSWLGTPVGSPPGQATPRSPASVPEIKRTEFAGNSGLPAATEPPTETPPVELKIAFLGALTGGAATTGREQLLFARLAIEDFNQANPGRFKGILVEEDTDIYPAQALPVCRKMAMDYVDDAGGATEGSYVSIFAPDIRRVAQAAGVVAAADAVQPGWRNFGPPAYVAAMVMLEAARRAAEAGDLTRAGILSEVAQTDMPTTILGMPIRFDENGEVVGASFFISQVRDGDFVQVFP